MEIKDYEGKDLEVAAAPKCMGEQIYVQRTVEDATVSDVTLTGACRNTDGDAAKAALVRAAKEEYRYFWTLVEDCGEGCGCVPDDINGEEVASQAKEETYTNIRVTDDCTATGTVSFTLKKFRRTCECMPT